MDIKPGSDQNPIRVKLTNDHADRSRGKSAKSQNSKKSKRSAKSQKSLRVNGKGPSLPVALLGTDDFDAGDVDLATVTLGDEVDLDVGVTIKPHNKRRRSKKGHDEPRFRASLEDVDDDGDLDLVMHFSLNALVANGDLTAETTRLCLNGMTSDEMPFRGCDDVTVRVGKR